MLLAALLAVPTRAAPALRTSMALLPLPIQSTRPRLLRPGQQCMSAPSARIDSFQTVSVLCAKCDTLLFRYKKKNGLKSKLVKCYRERICSDPAGLLSRAAEGRGGSPERTDAAWHCPSCHTQFARDALIHGRPALKLVGGKVRMAK
ncbi:hypothetical protein AB1Y20_001609 [Prymnesium parvum]|uniref:Uncharacterized protein n=1 Tax=Prymnesium parvum TaxID=97485 RepID=A0AB34KE43_PRYPA